VEELAPDRRLVAGAWSWVALAASIGRFDAPILQVAPRELADAFELLARRFADAALRRGELIGRPHAIVAVSVDSDIV